MPKLKGSLLLKKDKMRDIEIEINDDGTVLINRQELDHNKSLLEFLSDINPSNIDEIKDFLRENNVDLLFGEEILCG